MNYISIDVLFAKIITDLQLRDSNPNTYDWIEWTAEAMRKIGAFPQTIIRNTGVRDAYGTPAILEVSNYQTRLPDDFVKETIVSYAETEDGTYYVINKDIKIANYCQNDMTYSIQIPYLRTNAQTGFITLSYKAIPCDENGYPLIPDTEEFKEAIKWYIEMMLMYQEVRRNKEGSMAKYQLAESKWKSWKMNAYADAMMPQSSEEMNDLAKVWLRSVPRWHSMLIDGSVATGQI